MSGVLYEERADVPDYIYFQRFNDMKFVNYKFVGSHIHQSAELVFVTKGCMRCVVNNHEEEVSEGGIFIVNSYDTHYYEYVNNASAYILVVGKEYFANILKKGEEFNNFIYPSEAVNDEVNNLLRESYKKFNTFNIFQKRGFITSLIGALLNCDIIRKQEKNIDKDFFIAVSEYINAHYMENLNLEMLAKTFGYSKNYFSAIFNRIAGMNLNDYINRVRISKYNELRQHLDKRYTLKEIVWRCGFNSLETFYRVLKKCRKDEVLGGLEETGDIKEAKSYNKRNVEKKWAIVVGFGNRGQVYADYSLNCSEELGIAGVVDPNPFRRSEAKTRYNLEDDRLFASFSDFVKSGVYCDIVINATMDELHYETSMEILSAGYDMLMEKPIVPNAEQLMAIKRKADEKNAKVLVCHVLRYTPYYREIKKMILAGDIGEIVTMEMNEHVCLAHYLTSYVRGKWNSEESCGSGFMLAKSCHDLDLMCWLNNQTEPVKVSSFGSRSQFIKENKPSDATEYCYQCPHVDTCEYSAKKLYLEKNAMPFLTWARLNKPLSSITREEKEEFLKTDIYGKCAYDNLGDIVDRQNAIYSFKNGSCCSFTLVGGTAKPDRYIHIVGTKGEIEGKLESDEFTYYTLSKEGFAGKREIINVKNKVVMNVEHGGHNGGDYQIMRDLIAYLSGDTSSVSITKLEDSINGHLCVFAAEKSRKENRTIDISEIK